MKEELHLHLRAGASVKDEREPEDLRTRTKRFALRIIKMYVALPKTTLAQTLGRQAHSSFFLHPS